MFKHLKCFLNKIRYQEIPFYTIAIVFFIKLLTIPQYRIPSFVLLIYILVIKVISPVLDIIIKLFIIKDSIIERKIKCKEELKELIISLQVFMWKISFIIMITVMLIDFGIIDQTMNLLKELINLAVPYKKQLEPIINSIS